MSGSMLAITADQIQTWIAAGVGFTILVALAAFALRKGGGEALAVATSERDIYEERAKRFENDLEKERSRYEQQVLALNERIAFLDGQVDSLTKEVTSLRELVMLEKIPMPLAEEFASIRRLALLDPPPIGLLEALQATADEIVNRLKGPTADEMANRLKGSA